MKLRPFRSPVSVVASALTGLMRKDMSDVTNYGGGGWYRVLESFTGAFQRNIEVNRDSVLAYHAVYACATLIAQDISKMRSRIMEYVESLKIWQEVNVPAFSPILRAPNNYQSWLKFAEYWIVSKLLHGNTYVLLVRDNRETVSEMHILNPTAVRVLIADNGDVYYRLTKKQKLAGLESGEDYIFPATEIIHDRMVCLFHPMVGVSPIFACGLTAQQGINAQQNSATFFANYSKPGGILTAPGHIENDTASRVKAMFEENFGGANIGRTAVLGDGLEYKPISISFEDSQLIEQLKWTGEQVCSCFHVPPYMIGLGTIPSNIEAARQEYYQQCLQVLIESMEQCLDKGLGLNKSTQRYGVDLDIRSLLRMDATTRFKTYSDAIGAGWMEPNKARQEEDMPPVAGGETPYMQMQDYPLSALARRERLDAQKEADGEDGKAVSETAMNGAQVSSLLQVLSQTALRQIPIETSRSMIGAAFPLLDQSEIDDMVNPLQSFTPSPLPGDSPAPTPEPVATTDDSEDDDDNEPIDEENLDDEVRELFAEMMK